MRSARGLPQRSARRLRGRGWLPNLNEVGRPTLAVLGAAVAVGIGIVFWPVPGPAPNFNQAVEAGAPDVIAGSTTTGLAAGTHTLRWIDLIPRGWDPAQQTRDMQRGLHLLPDSDPRATSMLKKMRDIWDQAPVNAELDGRAVRIAGYVVPLHGTGSDTVEFLLVPYFGACIHTPPPPANQIVHVLARRPEKGLRAMNVVWVRGTLTVKRQESAVAMSGYELAAVAVDPYVQPSRK